MKSDREL